MINTGLLSGDKAVVDRSRQASIGDIVMAMAVIDGEFTIKTLGKAKNGVPRLLPANPAFNPSRKSHEHYTPEFKTEALKSVIEESQCISATANRLGMP